MEEGEEESDGGAGEDLGGEGESLYSRSYLVLNEIENGEGSSSAP